MNINSIVSRLVLITLLSTFLYGFKTTVSTTKIECNLTVEVLINNNEDAEVIAENATTPISYLFYDKNQKAISDKVDSPVIKGLEKGTYFVMVIDSKGCTREQEFTIL